MLSYNNFSRLLGAAVLATAGLVLPAAASAQGVPAYAQQQQGATQDETITGRVIGINDTWHITIADDRGFTDTVELHQGTIINPTGLTLAPGMNVTVEGYGNGPVFEANEIDTPYGYEGPLPVPVYYGEGWWYPGYEYGYGPSFSLFFNFGRVERRDFNHDRAFFGFRDNAYGHGYVAPRDTRFGYRPTSGSRSDVRSNNTNTRSNYSNPNANTRTNYSTRSTTVNNYTARSTNTQNYSPRQSYVTRGSTTTTNYTPRNTGSYSRPANSGSSSRPANSGSSRPANNTRPANNSHPSNGSSGGGNNDHHR
jgi:hypothetical protein